MKKQVAFALAAALSLSVAGTALPVSAANPFVDVPANHWAYDAMSQLQKDGVVSGYGDGTFRGDRTLTRYEMAAMIAKITNVDDKNSALVKRLQSEFGNELYNMGVRVDALEKNASTIKFTGDGHVRYRTGMTLNPGGAYDDILIPGVGRTKKSSGFDQRINLHMQAKVNDNVEFLGTIRGQNSSNARNANYPGPSFEGDTKTSSDNNMIFYRAEFKYTKNKFTTSVGRLNPTLGQGLIWDGEKADGIIMGYDFGRANLAAGYVDLAPTHGYAPSTNAFVANLGIALGDKVNFTAAYLDAVNSRNATIPVLLPDGYTFKQWAVGANAKLGSNFKFTGEYIKNQDAPTDDDKGYWTKLQWKEIDNSKPGTFAVYAEYMDLDAWAIDSVTWGHTLDVAGGDGLGGHGSKGWGLGFKYVLAKNINTQIAYYDLKPANKSALVDDYKKSYLVRTNFLF